MMERVKEMKKTRKQSTKGTELTVSDFATRADTVQVSLKTITGNTNSCAPLILEKRKTILLAYGSVIKSVCIQTGNLLATYEGHRDIVTTIQLYEGSRTSSTKALILSTSIDGTVNVWDLTNRETIISKNIGSPVLRMLQLPRLQDNNIVVDDKDDFAIQSTVVRHGYFVIHPEKNVKDLDNQIFQVLVTDLNDFMAVEEVPSLTLSSPLISSFQFSLKPDLFLDSSSNAVENALITIENKHVVFHLLSKHFFGVKTRKLDVGLPITALACHSMSGLLVVGTQYGEILVYRNVHDYLRTWYHTPSKKEKELDLLLVRSKLVWHSHAVRSLAFSMDGRVLYSGGEESVLTIWNLNKSLKSFIPRVGAPISAIVPFQEASQITKVLLSSADNGLKLINTVNMEVEWNWQALYIAQNPLSQQKHASKEEGRGSRRRALLLQSYLHPYAYYDQQSDRFWKPSFEIDPRSKAVVASGNLGQLQFFQCEAAIVSHKIDVINFLRVSRKDSPKHLYVPTITHYKFSHDGSILVTVDVKKHEEMYTEHSLKFWLVDGDKESSHELVSQMNAPHQEQAITALAVGAVGRTSDLSLQGMTATAGADGTVKIWKGAFESVKSMARAKDASQTGFTDVKNDCFMWKCMYSFQYRVTPVLALAWSMDLSVLAVAHDQVVSLWDPQTVSMMHSFVDDYRIKVRYLAVIEPRSLPQYGGGCGQAFLLVGSISVLRVYDLKTMQLLWSFSARYINACSVAKDESQVWKQGKAGEEDLEISVNGFDPLAKFRDEGWIAIACSVAKLHADDGEEVSSDSHEKKKKSKTGSEENQEKQQKAVSAANEILIFSPVSSTPLTRYEVPSKVISVALHPSSPTTSSSEVIALTVDSEVWSLSPAAAASHPSQTLQVASVKRSQLPVVIETVKPLPERDAYFPPEQKKEHLNKQLLAPASRVTVGNNWLKELIPDHSQDLPPASDITVDFLKAISATSSNHREGSSGPEVTDLMTASTLSNQSLPSDSHNRRDAVGTGRGLRPQSSKSARKVTEVDLDQVSAILEKKIPLLAKRSFDELNRESPVPQLTEAKKRKESHLESGKKDSHKGKVSESDNEKLVKKSVEKTPKSKEEVPSSPAVEDSRRKTRRMTRSESELSESDFPQSLQSTQLSSDSVLKSEDAKTPSKKKRESSHEVTPSKQDVAEEEPRMTRSRQRRKDSESESEAESERRKVTPTATPIAATRSTRSKKLETIPEEAKPEEIPNPVQTKVVEEEQAEIRSTRSSRRRAASELSESQSQSKEKEKEDGRGSEEAEEHEEDQEKATPAKRKRVSTKRK